MFAEKNEHGCWAHPTCCDKLQMNSILEYKSFKSRKTGDKYNDSYLAILVGKWNSKHERKVFIKREK